MNVGDKVIVDCIDGFGGTATIVEINSKQVNAYKVQMDSQNPHTSFWAHENEISNIISEYEIETLEHIDEVQKNLNLVITELTKRSYSHDESKLRNPEAEIFAKYTPKLKESTYGSEEYNNFLKDMKPALDHHYSVNAHHPEYYKNGIKGMSLVDIIEMLCDWLAATKRHTNGDIRKSIEINQKRFGYSDELKQIFYNTLPCLHSPEV